jgi:two-component system sensor histidine kinase ChiS
VQVKGKQAPVSVFEIMDGLPEKIINLKLKTRPDFETALFHYQYREFDEAKEYFNRVLEIHPEDEAAGLYLHRVNYFIEYGVPVGWEGVAILSEK